VHALAHITGGGLTENLPRVLPEGLGADIDLTSWELPAVFRWMAETGGISQAEMLKTFNCGVGMILSVSADRAEALRDLLRAEGETVYTLGQVTAGEGMRYAGALL
jgi:phosphoribosylformylglycinamidine cyclo-ligase